MTLTPSPVKVEVQRLQIPVLQPVDIRKEFASLGLPSADYLVVVSYGQLLSQEILDFPRIAPINVHASLLPRWRGASPIQHAILSADAQSGVSIQRMVKQLDAGPVYAQQTLALTATETATSLHDTLMMLGAELLVPTLLALPTPQPQEGEVTVCRKLTRDDGAVDSLTMTAVEIDRKVRALNPWPGVTCSVKETPLKLLSTSLEPQAGAFPLPCADGSILHLVTVQPAGKKPMSGADWARGCKA